MGLEEITWAQATKVWWSILWRTTMLSMLAGGIAGATAGAALGAIGHGDLAGQTGRVLGWLTSVPVSIGVIRTVVRKEFANFLLRLATSAGTQA